MISLALKRSPIKKITIEAKAIYHEWLQTICANCKDKDYETVDILF